MDVCLLAAAVLLTRCLRVFSFLAGCDGSACQLWQLVLPAALTVQQPVIAGLMSACIIVVRPFVAPCGDSGTVVPAKRTTYGLTFMKKHGGEFEQLHDRR